MAWLPATALCIALAIFSNGDMAQTHGSMNTSPAHRADNFQASMDAAMSRMNDGMANAESNGNPDHDFATMMIPHHQGAIDMAKAELLYGKDPVLRRLAQEIIVDQGSEITVMQSQLLKKSTHPNAR